MECTCTDFVLYQEHEVTCPLWEPPLTQAEIRQIRQRLVGMPAHSGRIVRWLPKLVSR